VNEIAGSDIILEQFGTSLIAGVGLDAMSSARPVIGNMRPELSGESIPICQARTPEEICAQLERLVFEPETRETLGRKGREYSEKNANIGNFARKVLDVLEQFPTEKNEKEQSFALDFSEELTKYQSVFKDALTPKIDVAHAISLNSVYEKDAGHAWRVDLIDYISLADNNNDPYRSPLILLEDGTPLLRHHAIHDEIKNIGLGRYSHWNERLIFSTSDNSNPNTNGRSYKIVLETKK